MRLPVLGLGTWQLHGDGCREAVLSALEAGYRHVDTAQLYENEDDIGRALEASGIPREQVFVTTKIAFDALKPNAVRPSIEESLRRLRTEFIDLLLIHWPSPDVPLDQTLSAMARVRDEGMTREIGVSNFSTRMMERASAVAPIFCNQVEYHPYLDQGAVLAAARRLGQRIVAYCPLAQGRVMEDPVLTRIGEVHGKSPAQVALRWLVEQPGVSAIPRSSKRSHLESNLDIFDFELTEEQRAQIDALGGRQRLIDPPWAPKWD